MIQLSSTLPGSFHRHNYGTRSTNCVMCGVSMPNGGLWAAGSGIFIPMGMMLIHWPCSVLNGHSGFQHHATKLFLPVIGSGMAPHDNTNTIPASTLPAAQGPCLLSPQTGSLPKQLIRACSFDNLHGSTRPLPIGPKQIPAPIRHQGWLIKWAHQVLIWHPVHCLHCHQLVPWYQ